MNDVTRYIIQLHGIVQGVGFRPFVHRTANTYNLKGCAYNKGASLVIDVEGRKECLDAFLQTVLLNPPVLAGIEKVETCSGSFIGYNSFTINKSSSKDNCMGFISPDTAVCEKCLEDIINKESGRYHYAFTNCTNCGPRYSVIRSLPYDRENTTMSVFKMCSTCSDEYQNPSDRRFHAQTNCCPECGPGLVVLDKDGFKIKLSSPVETARILIKQGKIAAIKGIGGYHLCCNAKDRDAVNRLRKRKIRPDKPLAVMGRDIQSIRKVCFLALEEEEILTGNRKPIVLVRRTPQASLPGNIAPGQKRLGFMLPYTPLHTLLFDEELEFLVMTSGNTSGMPICYGESDAVQRLKGIADFFLVHDREIYTPVDDSVVRIVEGSVMVSRCGRGYAPAAFCLESEQEILALGAEQKSSVCIVQKGYAHVSQYIGDLKDADTYGIFRGVVENLKRLFKTSPSVYAHDMNCDYLSTRYAATQEGIKIPVQHHHAHMVSCMAEHNLFNNVIAVIFDGTGLGTDGAVWGGEFLTGSRAGFERAGHLKYVTLQGGNSVIKEPWRSAASYLHSLGIEPESFLHGIKPMHIGIVRSALDKRVNCCMSSSMGRLFDCVAAIIGLKYHITYEAQAAIELENVIDEMVTGYYDYVISECRDGIILEYDNILLGIIRDLNRQVRISCISAKFHNAVSRASADCVCRISKITGIKDVVLGGGTFENTYLLGSIIKGIESFGFNTYYNAKIPINDGGISFGQAAAAAWMLREDMYVPCCSG